MGAMFEDVGLAWRGLRRPGFAMMALVILAVGFGSVIAVHSVVKGVLLDPLPVPEPDRVTTLWLADGRGSGARLTRGHLRDAEGLSEIVSGVAAFQNARGALEDPATGATTILYGAAVTPAYMRTLGVSPVMGRDFDADGFDIDAESAVLLSHRAWRQMYGEDPDVVGGHVVMDSTSADEQQTHPALPATRRDARAHRVVLRPTTATVGQHAQEHRQAQGKRAEGGHRVHRHVGQTRNLVRVVCQRCRHHARYLPGASTMARRSSHAPSLRAD